MIRIIIADDHLIIRQGLRLILETGDEFEIVAEASDGAEALKIMRRTPSRRRADGPAYAGHGRPHGH